MSTRRDRRRKVQNDNQIVYNIIFQRLKNMCINMFVWEGLPDSINERYLMETLFNFGKILWVDYPGLGLIAQSFTLGNRLNHYNEPTQFHLNSPILKYTSYNKNTAVVMYNNFSRNPMHPIVRYYAQRLYNIEKTIDMNTYAQRTPVAMFTDEKQVLTLQQLYDDYDSYMPVIIGDKQLINKQSIEVLNTNAPFVADKLTSLRHDILKDFYTMLAIDNSDTDKKERLVEAEATSNAPIIALNGITNLRELQRGVEEVNKMFKTNISVRLALEEVMEDESIHDDTIQPNE